MVEFQFLDHCFRSVPPGQIAGAEKQGGGHRKGHSSKGFKNYHHKDETGQTSTFFDEASDEGDHYNYAGQRGEYGEKNGQQFGGKVEDGRYHQQQQGKKGAYGQGYSVDDAQGLKGTKGQAQYYDGLQKYGQGTSYDDYGKNQGLHKQTVGGQQGGYYGNGFHKGGYGGGIY